MDSQDSRQTSGGRGIRGSGRGRGLHGESGQNAGRGANKVNRRKKNNDWAVTHYDSAEPVPTEYRDVNQICDGFGGRTVFNQRSAKTTKPQGRIRTEYRGSRRADFRGRGRGTSRPPLTSSSAQKSDFHTENTTEVYDFSNFSVDDFEKNFRGRGSARRSGSSRGFRGGPAKRRSDGNKTDNFEAKRSRLQDSQ